MSNQAELSQAIATVERQISEAKSEVAKKSLNAKLERLKEELKSGAKKGTSTLATLSSARKSVRKLASKDFTALIEKLSAKPEYAFLKGYSKDKLKDDLARVAKPMGYRFVGDNTKKPTIPQIKKGLKDGTVYYEARPIRSDVSRVVQLGEGGSVSTETIDLKFYNIRGQVVESGKVIIDYDNETITLASGKTYKVEPDREYTYRFLKTKIRAVNGIKGLSEFLKDINAPKKALNTVVRAFIDSDESKMATGGSVGKFEYKTVNTSTESGLKAAEKLKADGWKVISTGLETIQFERAKEKKMEDGGRVDLFEDYENIPANIQEILDKYSDEFGGDGSDMDYKDTANMLKEFEAEGYTFDYGLDNEPFGLRPIGVKLNELRDYEDFDDDKMAKGGGVEDCIDYIKNSESIKNNGYYLHINSLNKYVDSGAKIPKIKPFCLITFNSGGQKNLKAIDTINATLLSSEIAKLLNIDIELARIIVSEQTTRSKRFTMDMLDTIKNNNIIVADRETIVCTNLSNKYATGGGLTAPITFNVYNGDKLVFTTKSANKASDYRASNGKHLSITAVDSKGTSKKIYAEGGGVEKGYNNPEKATHVVNIDGYNYYLEKIDSTHFYMSNNPNSRGMAHHVDQHRGEPYYEEVRSWLKSTKYAEGGTIDNSYLGRTSIGKSFYGWKATTSTTKKIKGYDWEITTMKRYGGELVSTATGGKSMKQDGYSTFEYSPFEDPNYSLIRSKPKMVNEKAVTKQHEEALKIFIEKMNEMSGEIMATGGGIEKHRLFNFLQDDLATLQEAIKISDKQEIERFFSYWGQHLKSLKSESNEKMFNFLSDDLATLKTAIKEKDQEEIDKFFSYWGQHLESIKYATGGKVGEKTYNVMHNVGKAKYVVNFHNGVKTYSDGSAFFDIEIFKNLKGLKAFIKKLESEGYKKQMKYGGKTKSQSTKSIYIETIAGKTGLRTEAIETFVSENNLSDKELLNLVQGIGTRKLDSNDLISAVVGIKGNKKISEVVAFAKSDKAFSKMASGGTLEDNLLPPSKTYGENIEKAMDKFGISNNEARKKYGQYTIKQWSELLGEKMENGGEVGDISKSEIPRMQKITKLKGLYGYMPSINVVYYDSKTDKFYFQDFEGDYMEVRNISTLEQLDKFLKENNITLDKKMATGGSIPDNYEGRTPEDIWNNLSKRQRQHFLYDHLSEIEVYKNTGELPSSEIIKAYNSEWSTLDRDIKNRFTNHTREGQYATGGSVGGKKYSYLPNEDISKIVLKSKQVIGEDRILDGAYIKSSKSAKKANDPEMERAMRTLDKLKSEGKLIRLLDTRGTGKKYFQTIVPNKEEKGYWKRYESASRGSLGILQNELLSEEDVLNHILKTQPKLAKPTTRELYERFESEKKTIALGMIARGVAEDFMRDKFDKTMDWDKLTNEEKEEYNKAYKVKLNMFDNFLVSEFLELYYEKESIREKCKGTSRKTIDAIESVLRNIAKEYPEEKYAKGGGVDTDLHGKFGDDNPKLVNFDVDDLDEYETMVYNDFSEKLGKARALQILINNVEGDYTQLSPELAEIAEEQVTSEEWDEESNKRYFATGGNIDSDISKYKKQLIAKAKSKGLYENFGQDEVRKLEDKYGYTNEVRAFDNWAMNFDLSSLKQYAKGGGVSPYYGGMSEAEILKATVVYDNGGETLDRYTVFTPDSSVFGMSATGDGFNQYIGDDTEIEKGSHLGKRLKTVPKDIKSAVLNRMIEEEFGDGGSMYGEGGSIYENMTEKEFLNQFFGANVFTENPSAYFDIKKLSSSNDAKVENFINELKKDGYSVKKKSYSDFTSVMGVKKMNKMAKGGNTGYAYVPNADIEKIVGKDGKEYGQKMLLDGAYVKDKVRTPKMSRTQFEDDVYAYGEGGEIERNKKNNDWNSIFNFYTKYNSTPVTKGNLIKMAYKDTNGVDSAIPQSIANDVDDTFYYVYDYQEKSFGELVDLRKKLKFSNNKVDVTIVIDGDVIHGKNLPAELEDATFHQALAYVFKHDEVEAFDIRPKTKMATGGAIEIQKMKKEKEKMVSELFEKCGVFFAFSDKQFEENKTPLKEGEKYVSIGGGGYLPKGKVKELEEGMEAIERFGKETVKKKKLVEAEILDELQNHECFYTGDISDVVDLFEGTYTKQQIRDVYNKHREANQEYAQGGEITSEEREQALKNSPKLNF